MTRQKPPDKPAGDSLSIRVDLACGVRIGPGKVAVLEEVARLGSISAAGRKLDELGLKAGQDAYAVIKASDVMIGVD